MHQMSSGVEEPGAAELAPGGHSGSGLGPRLLLNLERSGVDGEGQTQAFPTIFYSLYILSLLHLHLFNTLSHI